jgi:hypothetical protein
MTRTGLPYGLYIRRTGYNLPRGPSADWRVLTTANVVRTNGLPRLPKLDKINFWPHPMIELCERRLTLVLEIIGFELM